MAAERHDSAQVRRLRRALELACADGWADGRAAMNAYLRQADAEDCAAAGHPYWTDSGPHSGRCYCGHKNYQAGGPID